MQININKIVALIIGIAMATAGIITSIANTGQEASAIGAISIVAFLVCFHQLTCEFDKNNKKG